jgi:hypothetical protein
MQTQGEQQILSPLAFPTVSAAATSGSLEVGIDTHIIVAPQLAQIAVGGVGLGDVNRSEHHNSDAKVLKIFEIILKFCKKLLTLQATNKKKQATG